MVVKFADFFPRMFSEFEKIIANISPVFEFIFERSVYDNLTVAPPGSPEWLVNITDFLSRIIAQSSFLGQAIVEYLDKFTLFELLFGGGLSILLSVIVIKWLIGVVWG